MKLLHIIPTMNPLSGGPCQVVRDLIPELEAVGIRNEVVCFDDPGEPFVVAESFTVHCLGTSKGPWQYNDKYEGWLIGHLAAFDAVIVHALWLYHGYGFYRTYGKLKKNGLRLPAFHIMPHGMLDPYFQKAHSRKLKTIRNHFYWRMIEARLVNEADGILFTCETELMLARHTFKGYHPKKELNIRLGIAPPPMDEQPSKDAATMPRSTTIRTPYWLYLGRIHEKKGVDLLVDGYIELAERTGPDRLPNLLVAGPGLESELGTRIQARAKAKGLLEKKMFFHGMMVGNDKWEAFRNCEAFVLPSHQENFGIAVAEALACGKPVLISDKVNIHAEIKASNAGIVNTDNLAGTIALLSEWIDLPPLVKELMGARAKECYSRYFRIGQTAKFLALVLSNEAFGADLTA